MPEKAPKMRSSADEKAGNRERGHPRTKRRSFDEAAFVLEELYESTTWTIFQAQHPFRDVSKEADVKENTGLAGFALECGMAH